MWPRLSIVAGLLAGVVVAGLVLGGLLLVGSGPVLAPPATPDAASPSPDGVASPNVSAGPSGSVSTASPPGGALGSPPPSSSALSRIGEAAPPLTVPRVGGGTIDLAALRGKPVWITFVGTSCAPCREAFPLMDGFATRHAGDGLVVLAIDVHEDEATVAGFANELGATFPLGLDTDGSAAAAWGAAALPVHLWVDAKGIVRDGAIGGIGVDRMATGVTSILPGVEVTP